MKKILVPVDFSEHSEYALEVAAAFAKAHHAEILVLHMMGLADSVFIKNESQEIAEGVFHMKLAEKQFAAFLDKPYLDGIAVTETVQNYKIFEEINDLAISQNIDLVIMGSHGARGLKEEFVGSNTERVVRTSEVPVLVVKGNDQTVLPKRVVFACDFKKENVKAYRNAIPFLERLGVKIDLVYVNLPADRFRSSKVIEARMEAFMDLAEFGKPLHADDLVIINGYSIEKGLYEYAQKVGADSLAIPTHGRRGISHFFHGSIAESIANHSKLPVFTFKM